MLFWSLIVSSAVTVGAYVLIAFIRIDTLAVWEYGTAASTRSFVMLLVICVSIFASFVGPGVIMATLFGRQPEGIGGLYFADLVGAGMGCATVMYFVSSLGAPAAVMLAAMADGRRAVGGRASAPGSAGGWPSSCSPARSSSWPLPGHCPSQRLDSSKTVVPQQNVVASGWGTIFRVDAARFACPAPDQPVPRRHPRRRDLQVEREALVPQRYDFPQDPRAIPFDVLGTAPKQEAIIGAAGGHEVLPRSYYRAGHIDAVELNPVTVQLVTTTFANFDGHLADEPARLLHQRGRPIVHGPDLEQVPAGLVSGPGQLRGHQRRLVQRRTCSRRATCTRPTAWSRTCST